MKERGFQKIREELEGKERRGGGKKKRENGSEHFCSYVLF